MQIRIVAVIFAVIMIMVVNFLTPPVCFRGDTVYLINPEVGDKVVIAATDNMLSSFQAPEDAGSEGKIQYHLFWSEYLSLLNILCAEIKKF